MFSDEIWIQMMWSLALLFIASLMSLKRGSGCCAVDSLLCSSLNLAFTKRKPHNIFIAEWRIQNYVLVILIYLQSECIEKYRVELCSKYRENLSLTSYLDKSYFVASVQTMLHDKLKHQVEQRLLRATNLSFISHWKLRYTMTGKQVDAAIDAFLV